VFHQAETLLLSEMPMLPIYIYASKNLIHPTVKNFDSNLLNQASYKHIYLDAQLNDTSASPNP
jgi:ABC-type oligopeptide transport system substrate-binding subunit